MLNLDKKHKVIIILISMFTFSILYLLLPDEDFSGVNNISELIKREILKDKVRTDIKKNVNLIEGLNTLSNTVYKNSIQLDSDALIDDVEKIEHIVEDEYNTENINKSLFEQYFSRIYFSIITGCLLGYGDVYPISIRAKFIAMMQALFTIIVIVL
jgi:tetrahydromethanopterin S-methyltransferase subunit B